MQIERGIGGTEGTETGRGRETGTEADLFTIRLTVRRMMMGRLVLIVIGVVNDYDYQGTILSQPHLLYQGQYSIGKWFIKGNWLYGGLILIDFGFQGIRCSKHVMGQHAPEKYFIK